MQLSEQDEEWCQSLYAVTLASSGPFEPHLALEVWTRYFQGAVTLKIIESYVPGNSIFDVICIL